MYKYIVMLQRKLKFSSNCVFNSTPTLNGKRYCFHLFIYLFFFFFGFYIQLWSFWYIRHQKTIISTWRKYSYNKTFFPRIVLAILPLYNFLKKNSPGLIGLLLRGADCCKLKEKGYILQKRTNIELEIIISYICKRVCVSATQNLYSTITSNHPVSQTDKDTVSKYVSFDSTFNYEHFDI